jgi:Kef-type K+ transport system membrane component KefB/nucleotide-binding universal stress UspA family protein
MPFFEIAFARPSAGAFVRRILSASAFAMAVLACSTASAWAAEGKGPSEGILIGQVVLLIVTGRLLGEAMLRIGQPAVMGQLMAGLLLGPSVLGVLWPDAQHFLFPKDPAQKAMLDGLSQFGILLLLLLTGMETELGLVRAVRRAAFSASIAGITLPFICGFALGQFLPEFLLPHPEKRLVTSLFLGTALSISSVKIVASVVRDMGFLRRNVGQVILASAVVDDTIGWIIIAVTLGLAGQESFSWMHVAQSVIGTLLFLAFSFTIGRRMVFKIIQFTNDHFRGEAPVIAAILVVMGGFALITNLIGVHTVLGAFVAGILVGESPILTEEIDKQFRGIVAGLFMPVFFGLAGLSADLTILSNVELALLTAGLIAIASIGKAAGAFTGGYFGGLTGRESLALATGMNARGSTEVIVATIGLSMGVLSQNLFTMIVAMALITTMLMPPTLRWALRRLPMRKEERQRLAREEFEEKAFVPNLERLLVVVDGSPNSKFALRLAGLLAGSRGMTVTVLPAATTKEGKGEDGENDKEAADKPSSDKEAADIVRHAAEKAESVEEVGEVDVITRNHTLPLVEAISEEARRGYDLMVIGVHPIIARTRFTADVSKIAGTFEGSIMMVDARGEHRTDPLGTKLNFLTPVTGNETSRRGAEVAVTIAKSAKGAATALSVINPSPRGRSQRRREAEAVLEEIGKVGTHHKIKVSTLVRAEVEEDAAILNAVKRTKSNIIGLGVSRRPGDELAFGHVAAALLKESEASLIFVAPQSSGAAKSSSKGPEKAATDS